MTIAFTGGGSGGHFYPIIAIAEALHDMVREKRLLEPRLYYLGPAPFDKEALFENEITFIRIPAGKMRRYASIQNFFDFFPLVAGILAALATLFRIYPDVLVSKGGYTSVPSVIAAHLLGIPIIIHESDAKPGRANLLGAKFAKKIAISFESAAAYFPKKVQKRIARTGTPVRAELLKLETEGARQYLHLEEGLPTVLILGGSQGSQHINDAVVAALPELVAFTNIIHQTGKDNFKNVQAIAAVALAGKAHAERYHSADYLNGLAMRRAAGAADLIVSRAGAGAIAEIAAWKKPAILIPIPEAVSHDQRANAYAYARTGAAVVIEEQNLAPHILISEIKRIVTNPALASEMGAKGALVADPDAARLIAGEVLDIALSHG